MSDMRSNDRCGRSFFFRFLRSSDLTRHLYLGLSIGWFTVIARSCCPCNRSRICQFLATCETLVRVKHMHWISGSDLWYPFVHMPVAVQRRKAFLHSTWHIQWQLATDTRTS
eukprot:2434337-Amphidinium_carterae.2